MINHFHIIAKKTTQIPEVTRSQVQFTGHSLLCNASTELIELCIKGDRPT